MFCGQFRRRERGTDSISVGDDFVIIVIINEFRGYDSRDENFQTKFPRMLHFVIIIIT